MKLLQIKTICVFSTGSLYLVNINFIKFRFFNLLKKDLLSNRKTNYKVEKKYLLKYKNKYLKSTTSFNK